jgi:hypothetical protein
MSFWLRRVAHLCFCPSVPHWPRPVNAYTPTSGCDAALISAADSLRYAAPRNIALSRSRRGTRQPACY